MTQITIPAQVVNGRLQYEKSLTELEGQKVVLTLTIVPNDATNGNGQTDRVDWRKWRAKIESMKALENGWDSFRAPAPSADSIVQAAVFLEEATRSEAALSRMAPSVVGGVGFTFKHANRKVYVEFRNSGSVHALLSDGLTEPVVEKVLPSQSAYADLMLRIKGYLNE